jgi:porin
MTQARTLKILGLTCCGLSLNTHLLAETAGGGDFGSPTSIENTLADDDYPTRLKRWNDLKKKIEKETALHYSFEYSSLAQGYTDAGAGEDFAASGIARFYGTWTPFNHQQKNWGRFSFRIDNRHRYTDVAPQNAGFTVGQSSINGSLYSDREWGLVNLQWTQSFLDERLGISAGVFPADDYFHAYALANPLTHFSNLAFTTGGVTSVPDSGVAIAGAGMITDQIYFKAGVHDTNGSAADPNLDVFGDWELYKNIELGWTSKQDRLYLDNVHLGLWHADARDAAGAPESWGVAFNWTHYYDDCRLMPFIRGGWSDGGAALYEKLISAGVAKTFREKDVLGLGVSWSDPSDEVASQQWSNELFYRIQLENLAITPSLQMIVNPSYRSDTDVMFVGGLRARIVF